MKLVHSEVTLFVPMIRRYMYFQLNLRSYLRLKLSILDISFWFRKQNLDTLEQEILTILDGYQYQSFFTALNNVSFSVFCSGMKKHHADLLFNPN